MTLPGLFASFWYSPALGSAYPNARRLSAEVTGKLDVREAAAGLGDEEENEELDGAEGLG